ncbi:Eugenol synthase 1 [Phytophthora nicotianae]|uniref:Eugenol synthase 1 n=2 Tax=Phytophthora nicotianae TaxID=4792 RepID=A0A0W8CYC2_PHYNI|nr:hypothetical protein F444_00552 [Phytophthora nicotianae P1976]KUF64741.1 Eugenol synthase 1 [Phytophthora nicotianae]KUF89183.1 Eugenol synthase 1 [Phytophthora nicotianae]
MSKFTKFAIIGAGGVGSCIADDLLKANATITILTRDDGKAELQPLKERGATLAKVNYDDETSLQGALVGSEVVVCSINSQHLASQFGIARAAKAAGIQLFVPTEFGFCDEDGANATKQEVRQLLNKLDMPSTLFHSGLWSEYLPFMLGYNIDEGAISVADEGDAKISIVTRSDFSHFVAHVLTTASKDSLEGAQLSIETGRVSPKEIAAQLEKKLGTTFRIKVLDYEETKKGYDTNVMAYLQTRIADGRCVPGTEEEVKSTIAKFFPEWDPSPWEEIIA